MHTNGTSSIATSKMPDYLIALAGLFEENFSIDWLVEMTGHKPSEVLSALEELTETGKLKRKQPGIYYLSNGKTLQQENALSSEEKMAFNRRIADILLKESMNDGDRAKAISFYLLQIHNDETGFLWLNKAGNAFLQEFNTERALQCYLSVIEGLSDRNQHEESALIFMESALQYGKIAMARQETTKILSILKNALELAVKFKKPEYEALLKMSLAKSEWLHMNLDDAMRYFDEGRILAESLDDKILLRKLNKFNTFFYFWQGRYKEVTKSYERFVPELMRFPEGRFPLVGVLITALCYVQTGQLSQGLGLMDAMRLHCHEIGDRHMESYAVCGLGLIMLDIRNIEEALHHFTYGLEMAIKERNGWMAILCRLCLALCYYLTDNYAKSSDYLNQFIQLSKQVQISSWPHPYFMELCWAIEQGKLPAIPGISMNEETYRLLRTRNVFMQGLAYRYDALLKRKNGARSAEVMESLNLSLDYFGKAGSLLEVARTQLQITRQHLLTGNEEEARKVMIQASSVLTPLNEALIPDDLRYLITSGRPDGFLLKEILTLGQEIIDIRESRELVLKVISSVNRITGAERGAIFLWDGTKLELKASKNLSPEQIFNADFKPSMEVIMEVVHTGRGCIKNMGHEVELRSLHDRNIVQTVICVPMILRGHVKGVLYHDNRLLGSSFQTSDLELLAYFAAQVAIALDNVTSYEEMQQLNEKLTEEKNYFEEQYHFSKISVENIIGKSSHIKRLLQQIQQVAQTDANALILGDTGVGKELVASAIHKHSDRKDNPFICVQCSALPEKLLPSELFGHEKGAFTGAVKRRIGRFELANKGTIFLDEIGDLQPDMQVQLLRVLETKQFERIGGSETLRSDFRLIAATNRNLKQMSTQGSFRMDLYYRLNVFPIHVPSLMERKEDIPLLIDYFVKIYSKKLGRSFEKISPEDMRLFMQYDWPGNIRELENIVERAVILNHGPLLRFSGLFPSLLDSAPTTDDAEMTLDDNERHHIIRTLKKTNWKVRGLGGAAELLNINPSTLAFRMKKLGIKRP